MTSRSWKPIPWFVVAAHSLVVLIAGCTNSVATVEGVVTLAGQPLSRGTVTFHPQGGGTAGYGEIAADGRYFVRSGSGEGLQPGRYDVTVVALEASVPSVDPHGMPSPGKPITPSRYASVSTSGLMAEVVKGANRLDFQLNPGPQQP